METLGPCSLFFLWGGGGGWVCNQVCNELQEVTRSVISYEKSVSRSVIRCFIGLQIPTLIFFSELIRYRPKGVFGKGVGNSKNASEMRQKCVKNASEMRQNGSCFIGKRGTSKIRQKSVKIASKMRQKCAEHLWGRTPFGRYLGSPPPGRGVKTLPGSKSQKRVSGRVSEGVSEGPGRPPKTSQKRVSWRLCESKITCFLTPETHF